MKYVEINEVDLDTWEVTQFLGDSPQEALFYPSCYRISNKVYWTLKIWHSIYGKYQQFCKKTTKTAPTVTDKEYWDSREKLWEKV